MATLAQALSSPQKVTRRRRLADTMMQQGGDTSPVGHPFQALARVLQGGMGGYMAGKADRDEQAGSESVMRQLDSKDYTGVLGNQWANENQGRLAQYMMEQSAPPKPPGPTSQMQNFEYGQQHPEFVQQQMDMQRAGGTQVNNNIGKLNEGQAASVNYYTRGKASNDALAPIENALTHWDENMAAKYGGDIGNFYKSPEFQLAERHGKEVIAMLLRKDTGAAVTPDEMAYYGPMYLPQPGDTPDVVMAKREARSNALEAMKRSMGDAGAILDGPQPGMVEDGFRFKGGNPGNPNSWEPVQ